MRNLLTLILLVGMLNTLSYAAPVNIAPANAETPTIQSTTTTQSVPPNNLLQQLFTLQQISGNNGLLLRGAAAARLFYLPLMPQWKVNAIQLHFKIYHAILSTSAITLTLYVNDNPISSSNLSGVVGTETTWDVTLPRALLNSRSINLRITSNVNDYGFSCYNLSNPNYWVFITGDSTVTYQYQMQNYTPDLTKFPYPFINDPSIQKDKILMVLPETPSLSDLTAAFYVANALTVRQTWRGVKLIATSVPQLTDKDKTTTNVIFIGTPQELDFTQLNANWPLSIDASNLLNDKSNAPFKEQTGVIMVAPSLWNAQYAMLAVTGNGEAGLQKAAQMLRDPNFTKSVLFNEYALVDYVPTVFIQKPSWTETSFRELGYKDQVIYGNGENVITYNIDLPMIKTTKSLRIKLNYSISPFLSLSQSSFLSVIVNDIPVNGTAIKHANSPTQWDVTIPANNLQPGPNSLSFKFNLKLRNRDCTPEDSSLAWGTIYADSSLTAQFDPEKPYLRFATFAATAQNVILTVPNQTSFVADPVFKQQLVMLGNKFTTLNSIRLMPSLALRKEADGDNDIIFIGQLTDNAQLSTFKNHFPFYFDNKKLVIEKQLLPYIAISDETPIGLLEIIPSPFNSNKLFLLISALNPDGYRLAFELLTDPQKAAFVNGNVVLIYANGTFTSLQSQRLMMKAGNQLRIKEIGNTVYYIAIGLVVGVILLIILIRIWRRLRRYYYGK